MKIKLEVKRQSPVVLMVLKIYNSNLGDLCVLKSITLTIPHCIITCTELSLKYYISVKVNRVLGKYKNSQ